MLAEIVLRGGPQIYFQTFLPSLKGTVSEKKMEMKTHMFLMMGQRARPQCHPGGLHCCADRSKKYSHTSPPSPHHTPHPPFQAEAPMGLFTVLTYAQDSGQKVV